MKAQELRIGNKVQANGVYPCEVKTFKRINSDLDVVFFSDGEIGEYLVDCEGIPLTEEILLKCGFKQEISCNGTFERWVNDCVYIEKINHAYHHDFIAIGCVHTLQNLYFSLTGEELEINL